MDGGCGGGRWCRKESCVMGDAGEALERGGGLHVHLMIEQLPLSNEIHPLLLLLLLLLPAQAFQ